MLPQLHQHVLSELDRSVRADTVFVFGAVVLDVVSIAVTSSLADSKGAAAQVIFWVFMVGVVVVTVIAATALRNGTKGCLAYHSALVSMYEKNGVAEHFPAEGIRTGLTRYRLYLALVCVLGSLAIAVPLLVKFLN
jgi:hypothetical protein